MRIFVGNVNFAADEAAITELFKQFGPVTDVFMPRHIDGRPRGFCFVDMDDFAASDAINHLSGVEFMGRKLTVNEARPAPSKGRRDVGS